MKFSLPVLVSLTNAAAILGSVSFYTADCPGFPPVDNFYTTTPDTTLTPKDSTTIKSLQWEYPSNSYQLSFYLDKSSTDPYAVVTGLPHQTFQGNLCGFHQPHGLTVLHVDEELVGKSNKLFLQPESYVKFTLV
ncbi:hypothetical protein HDV01_005887 [Terramyces sp. JEL0728]|nr:hypothetical protein HDV01_005887 [Terramyces sp. JEL0728]